MALLKSLERALSESRGRRLRRETADMSQQENERNGTTPTGSSAIPRSELSLKMSFGRKLYISFLKRFFDIVFSILALIVFSPLLATVAIIVRTKLGSPVIFKQIRPGKKDKTGEEKLFTIYKFRTMTEGKDENGKLLPDDQRLTRLGKILRDTSIDELPELWNILKGDMAIIGPRPQLVRDMVFMTEEQRRRHSVKPGLSGWAQINGRNCIKWEDKLNYDLEYLGRISLLFDIKIVLLTIGKVIKTESISFEGMGTAEDYGDYLLRTGRVDKSEYDKLQEEAKECIKT